MLPLLFLLGGLVVLVVGAEVLVRGASRLALAAGLSPLVIGLVVVALGTSAPEVAVTVGAALQGRADLAVGNVVGSNTFNVLFILGVSALVAPLIVGARLVRLDIPIMLGMSLLFIGLVVDGTIGLLDGLLLLVLAVAYTVMNVWLGRKESATDAAARLPEDLPAARPGARSLAMAALFVVGGVALLVLGARFAVDGASDLARSFGISDLVIGLTVVAAGTSLPEVATSVLAAARGQRDIAIGNVIGSCTLNIAVIIGIAGVIAPSGLGVSPGVLSFDLPVMAASAAIVLPIAFTGQAIARWEGGLFLAFYVAYVTYLLLNATVHPEAQEFGFAMQWFVIPFTVIVLMAALTREWRARRRSAERS